MRTSPRRRAREFALQGIYQWLLSGNDPALIRTQLAEASGFAKCDTRFFDGLWRGITSEFDTLVAAFAPFLDRSASELSPVEKSILTIGAWELLREPEVPYRKMRLRVFSSFEEEAEANYEFYRKLTPLQRLEIHFELSSRLFSKIKNSSKRFTF